MSDVGQEKAGQESPMADWMKSMTDFYVSATNMWLKPFVPQTGSREQSAGYDPAGIMEDIQKSWMAPFGMLQGMCGAQAGDPDAMSRLFKSLGSFPDFAMKLNNTAVEGCTHLYNEWVKHVQTIGEAGNASSPANKFETWVKFYEKEIQPLFKVPQLGLARFYQEKVNHTIDKFNLFQAALADLFQHLYVPVERSVQVMEQKIKELGKEGKLSNDFKDYYDLWIKTLEGDYSSLLKSPEYLQSLYRTLNALEEFRIARQDVLMDMLQMLPIPTNKDMDELYREFHSLKKKVKDLEKRVGNKESSV